MVGTTKRQRVNVLGGLAVATCLTLAACGGSDSRYVVNSQENLFFKIPRGWTETKLTDTDKDGRPASIPEGFVRVWHYAYDAAADPSGEHLGSDETTDPVSDVAVWALSDAKNDLMSQSQVRSVAFGGFDPLLQDAGSPPKWEVVNMNGKADVRLNFPKGVTGTRMAVNVPNTDDATKFHTIDATTLLDPLNKRVYILRTSCASQCYLDNRKVIDAVAESWTVNRT